MATRRQTPNRLLSSDPMRMQSDFDLNPNAQQGVGGVMQARTPQGGIDDSPMRVLNGLAEWGSKKIREAAKTRYETLAMEGAVAYQQGKAVDELQMDGNKWMLEGYRNMEASTVSAALMAAQQEEISLSLHEADPDAFRARYTERMNAALAGKDERTQDMIKKTMLEQMPSLVAQHTREHAKYLEGQNYDALTSSIDVMSRNPMNSDQLLDFALGGSGSEGLSEERRKGAVIDGVIRAYANGNPMAYSMLEGRGVFDNLTTQEAGALRAAQQAYEGRVRSTYDETRFKEEQALMATIELGEMTPEEAVAAWAEMRTRHGLTMDAGEAQGVYNGSSTTNKEHTRAINLEIETAKINGDFGKVAELSYEYANRAANPGSPGTVYDHNIEIQYAMGPNRPNKPSEEIQSVIGRTVEDVLGKGAKVVITSGQEDPGKQHGSNRHKTGNAADVAIYRADGSIVKATDPEMEQIAIRGAELGVEGIGFGAEYMGGDHIHMDLVGTDGGGGNVWASGAKAVKDTIVGAIQGAGKGPALGKVDPERWKMLVDRYDGDLEAAAVAYSADEATVTDWLKSGRKMELPPDTQKFMSRVVDGVTGKRYVTAADRGAMAEEAYKVAREAAAVDVYAVVAPQMAALDDAFLKGSLNKQDYAEQTAALRNQWGIAQSKADVDQMIALGRMKQEALNQEAAARLAQQQADATITSTPLEDPKWIQARKDEEYAQRVGQFDVERTIADDTLIAAIESITTADKPDGVSDAAFLASQQQAIQMAQTEHQKGVADLASKYGVEWKDSAAVETAKKGIAQVRAGLDKALKNSQEIAIMERAVNTGTLGSQSQAIKDRAYEAALSSIDAETTRFATTPRKDGSMPDAAAVGAFQQGKMEDWFAKTNYVPPQVRNEFSSVVSGQLVKDGVVDQHALDAITAYAALKQKSSVAADKLLDPQAKLVADAALATAGTPEALPRVLLDMWAKGLNSPFTGKEPPPFAERGDVQKAIQGAVKAPGLVASIFGAQASGAATLDLTPEAQSIATELMTSQVQKLFDLNPNLDPAYTVKLAEEALLKSAVPIMQEGYGFLGSAPGESFFGLGNGENSLLIDPTGGNIMEQTFGADAPKFEGDRSNVSKAITGYLSSDKFKSLHGDMTPTIGAGEWLWEALPFTDNQLRKSNWYGTPIFSAQHVGNGNLYIDFRLDGDGTTKSVLIPLNEVGDWYKDSVRQELTK